MTTQTPPPADLMALSERSDFHGNTGIYVRAKCDGKWGSHDIAELSGDSLLSWLRTDGGCNPRAENTLLTLFNHDQDARPSLSAQAVGEPVMWRAPKKGGGYMFFDYRPTHLRDFEPLYTTPPQPADGGDRVGELVEALRKCLRLLDMQPVALAASGYGLCQARADAREALAKFQPAGGES